MGKKVYQYSLEGELLKSYVSVAIAANDMGVHSSSISRAISLGYETKGFIWKTDEGDYTTRNVLVIGDLHEPFTLKSYLAFCKEVYDKYKCNQVVFIGDIIDMHYSSFHATDGDGHSAARELELAKENIAEWYRVFPRAKVCLGNHDLLSNRKVFSAGLSSRWIKSIGDVLDTPEWTYKEEFIIDDVLYTHGTGRKAKSRMSNDLISVVQGHYHSESYIWNTMGVNNLLFAMQVGTGADQDSYAMAYGKPFNKMHINCGVVLNNGKLPILEYMINK